MSDEPRPEKILVKRENGEYSVWLGFPETVPQRTHRALIDFVETGRLIYYRDDEFTKTDNLLHVQDFLKKKEFTSLPVVLQTIDQHDYSNLSEMLDKGTGA